MGSDNRVRYPRARVLRCRTEAVSRHVGEYDQATRYLRVLRRPVSERVRNSFRAAFVTLSVLACK